MSAPGGSFRAVSLIYDAVELGGRVLAAAAAVAAAGATAGEGEEIEGDEGGRGQRHSKGGMVDWPKLARGVRFEGLSGTVSFVLGLFFSVCPRTSCSKRRYCSCVKIRVLIILAIVGICLVLSYILQRRFKC